MVAREDLSKEVTFHLRPCVPRTVSVKGRKDVQRGGQ